MIGIIKGAEVFVQAKHYLCLLGVDSHQSMDDHRMGIPSL